MGRLSILAGRVGTPRLVAALALVALALVWWGVGVAQAQGPEESQGALETIRGEIDHLRSEIEGSVDLYASGRTDEAVDRFQEAFFFWEASSADKRLRSADLGMYNSMEGDLLELRGLMLGGAPEEQVRNKLSSVLAGISEAQTRIEGSLDARSGIAGFFESFILIVREGFEAILVIAAVLAYLNRTGHRDRAGSVYKGAGLGVLASILTAVALQAVFSVGIFGQEMLEGITALVAVAFLFYISHWLIGKVQHDRWESFLKGKIQSALATGSTWTLGLAAFLAVYREGFETVLFYQALTGFYPGQFGMLAAGFGAGVVVLVGLYTAFHFFQVKIPLRPFFIATSLMLYYLAFSFAGKGVRALQEAGVVGVTPLEGAPRLDIMGIFPTMETMLAQAVLLVLFVAGVGYTFLRGVPKKEKEQDQAVASHV